MVVATGRRSHAHLARVLTIRLVSSVIVLTPSERWCTHCGESVPDGSNTCPRCEGQTCIDPKLVLRSGEYLVL